MNELWSKIDRYITDHLVPHDSVLETALEDTAAAGMPAINVAPNQGKFLYLLARLCGARRVLEIGTLGGYSTIWLARALPNGGRLITLEADPNHARVAKQNLSRAGLSDVVELRVGPALDTLPQLAAEETGPFDLIFIDADKRNNPNYLDWAVRLSRPSTLLIVDNVVRGGGIVDRDVHDEDIEGTRRLFGQVATDSRIDATAVQTVGSKGHDGFLLALIGAATERHHEGASWRGSSRPGARVRDTRER